MLKRTFDLFVAVISTFFALPLLLFISLGIKLSSRGPVLFKQTRIGRFGKSFVIYKFRSMHANPVQTGPCISAPYDPRETRFGHYLRLSKLDELPQLLNILKGDMSLVGPRPEVPEIVARYSAEQREVLNVRPGLIGPAQIIGRNEEDMFPKDVKDPVAYYLKNILPDKLRIDAEYAKHSRLLTDMQLLGRAVLATLSGLFHAAQFKNSSCWPYLFYTDLLLIFISYVLAYALRFDWAIPRIEYLTMIQTLPILLVFRSIIFIYFQLYKTYYRYLSIHDFIRVAQACTLSTLAIVLAVFFIGNRVHSRSIFIIDWMLLAVSMGGVRLGLRMLAEKRSCTSYKPVVNVLIIGAGDLGEMLAREYPKNGVAHRVVGFIDDDPAKIGSIIGGVRVYGDRHSIPRVAESLHVDEILIAINGISSEDMESIIGYCKQVNVTYKVVPAMTDMVNGAIRLSRFRKVELSDLMGRTPLKINFGGIEGAVKNKRVLVTGAGGSIGSELCRQLASYQPEKLILLDRNENYLFELLEDFNLDKSALKPPMECIIADITNTEKLERIFSQQRPQLVFHTAAQKHVPLSEQNPDEAIINNILGTQCVAMMADRFSCQSVLFVSTDKAVKPSSVMGATKRVAELLLKSFSEYSQTRFIIVRFGNVLNSHGSVVPLFMKQIEKGGPLRVTDPNMERYFMSIPEAVNLILQAMIMGRSGDIYILNMGKSIKIETLALNMIKLAGLTPRVDIDIEYTQMRPGEKLQEELVNSLETTLPTPHPMIKKIVQSTPMLDYPDYQKQIDRLISLARNGNHPVLFHALKRIVPELPTTAVSLFSSAVVETRSQGRRSRSGNGEGNTAANSWKKVRKNGKTRVHRKSVIS